MSVRFHIALLALVACTSGATHTTDDTDLPEGDGWQMLAEDVPGGLYLSAWSNGADQVLIAGGDFGRSEGILARYEGDTLCVERGVAEGVLWWVHGRRPGDWYAVGEGGTILHEVDGVRTDESVPTEATLYGAWDDGTDVWAVGGDVRASPITGEVWRKQAGGAWTLLRDDLPGPAFKVWEDWIVGDSFAYQIDGDTLVEVPLPATYRLLTVRGVSDTDLWAVGGSVSPVMIHWDGSTWTEQDIDARCRGQALNGVYVEEGYDVAVAGHFGVAAILGDEGWSCPEFPMTERDFHAVWRHGDELLFVGGNLFSTSNNVGVIGMYGAGKAPLTVSETCE